MSGVVRLLDRYLLRELLLPLTCCVGGFVVFFLVFDAFDNLDEFQRNHLNAKDVFDFLSYRMPQLLVTSYVLPMSLLLALLYALTSHARHHELTAMRAAGISMMRIALPYFLVGALFSALFFYVNEQVVPDTADAAEQVLARHNVQTYKAAGEKTWQRGVAFVNAQDNRTWQIGAYHTRARQMWLPQVEWRFPDGGRLQLFAERGRWINRHWVFTNVQQFYYAPNVELPVKTILTETNLPRMIETPRLIASEIKISSIESLRSLRHVQLSAGSILDYLKLHPRLEEKKLDSLLTMLHSRLAAPWTCLVVVLIAIPFGALPGRRNVFVGVASSITICFIFFVAQQLALAIGSGGHVPPWFAAWLPNAVFAAVGVYLIVRLK